MGFAVRRYKGFGFTFESEAPLVFLDHGVYKYRIKDRNLWVRPSVVGDGVQESCDLNVWVAVLRKSFPRIWGVVIC